MKNLAKLMALFLLLAPALSQAQAPGGAPSFSKSRPHKARKARRPVKAKVDPLAGLKCPAGSGLQDRQPSDGFVNADGTGVMICSESHVAASSVTLHAGLQAYSFAKDGSTRDLTPERAEGNFRVRAWKGRGLKIEKVEYLPVRGKGEVWRWVAISSRASACEGGTCGLTPETCALDTRAWDPAPDTIKKARGISLNGAAFGEDLSSHLLAAALAGDRSAAHYLDNGSTLFKLDGASGEAMRAVIKVLSYARALNCPGVPLLQ